MLSVKIIGAPKSLWCITKNNKSIFKVTAGVDNDIYDLKKIISEELLNVKATELVLLNISLDESLDDELENESENVRNAFTDVSGSKIRIIVGSSVNVESSINKRRKKWNTYIASDGYSVELPPQITDLLCSDEYVPEARAKFANTLRDLKAGDLIEMPNLGQTPKYFAQGYLGKKFLVINQMIELWETFSKDQQHSIKRVLSYQVQREWGNHLLTAAELGKLVEAIRTDDFAVPFVEAIWNMLQQKYRKTLFLADEHGVLFSNEPVPARLHILKPMMRLTYWSEHSLGARVVLTGIAHAKFEKKYLINGIYEWIEFVGPLPEDIFDSLLILHPFLGHEKIVSKVKEVTNCIPRVLIYLDKHVKSLNSNYIPDGKLSQKPSIMFLKLSYIESSVSFDWEVLGHWTNLYRTFPLPRDVSVPSLKDGQLCCDNFEEILFQQMLNHRNVLFKAANLAENPTTDVHIQFEHFIALEKDQLAPGPQHATSLVLGFARYPRFDFMIGHTFIQVSVNPLEQHNKESASISKAFERYYKYGNGTRNQIKIYLDVMFGGRHTAKIEKGRFEIHKNGIPVPDFRIVYMQGSPGTPKHTKLIKKYWDLAFINYEEIKNKLFGDFLRN
ncbi:11840_t:CDS:2 [Funneliformis mosseae]|uniref:11840_t:CDS:1 n=1 Tax=Funneliformis mosseae TaxID=27381 RepID=A0A9N9HHS2_FUNMO|nr:11840_t:CDS:2 [Funneliformis mosseae]